MTTIQYTRKTLPKPTLKRSVDLGYETLVAIDLITAAEIAADPPLLDLDDATFSSTSHDSFYQLSLTTMDEPAVAALSATVCGLCSTVKQKHLDVVEVKSSASKTHNQPVGENDGDDLDDIHAFDYHSRRVYSTDKPVNFSLQASPVKKQDSTLNETLDCSFDVPLLNSIDVEKSLLVVPQDLTWACFAKEPFQKSVEISLSSSGTGQCDDDGAFATSVFEGLESIAGNDKPWAAAAKISVDANAIHTLIGQVELLTGRLERLERILLSNNTAQVSESSEDFPHNRAFIIENTELLEISAVNEDITINDNNWGEDKSKGSKFSLKRMMRSRRFGGKS